MNWTLLGKRAETMRWAAEHAPDRPTIVETGLVRTADLWEGDGMSTVVWESWAAEHGGRFWGVDIDPKAVASAESLAPAGVYAAADSVYFLTDFGQPIDLLYLDSHDYPDGPLRDIYGGKDDIAEAIRILNRMGEDEIVARHGDLILPSQEHCAAEVFAALPWLHDRSIVVIDDADLPGGGKARLARKVLAENGWRCALDAYQTVWTR